MRYTYRMMISKRKLQYYLAVIQNVKWWQLVLAFVVMLFWSAFMLRQNSLHMIDRRDAVEQADEQNKDVAKALTELRNYVATHMNTSMGDRGIYLEHSYQRAYDKAVQAAEQGNGAAVYQQADKDCQTLFSRTSSFQAYIQCVTDKVAASGASADPVAAIKAPSADVFRYNFTPPLWSPDAAGWSVLATVLLGFFAIVRVFFVWVIHILLRRRHQ